MTACAFEEKGKERKEITSSHHQSIGNVLHMSDCLSIKFRGRNMN